MAQRVISLLLLAVVLGGLTYLAYLKAKPVPQPAPAAVAEVVFTEPDRVTGAEEFARALKNFLEQRGFQLPSRVEIEIHDRIDFSTADKDGRAMVAGIFYPPGAARWAVWARCGPEVDRFVCHVGGRVKIGDKWVDAGEAGYSQELSALISIAIADALDAYLHAKAQRPRLEWSFEMFEAIAKCKEGKWEGYLSIKGK